jgi:DNA-binding NarL/FixJ family response regulator/archaellum biogenesis ATPase FlaH
MIISSSPKSGKMTFLLYLIAYFYKEKALLFTPQESHIFKKKLDTLSNQFSQFSHIKKMLQIYRLCEDFQNTKQKYGYKFLLKEFEKLITNSKEKIIVIHRIGEFFDFQDRYEIDNFYNNLIKIVETQDKKIIFLANDKHENFKYIYQVAEEFSDVLIEINKNEKNERILNIMDTLFYREYPPLRFRVNGNSFLLEYKEDIDETKKNKTKKNKTKNILIVELNQTHENIRHILSYIFDKPNFNLKYADSLQGILQEIFIQPDLIIVLMKREKQNIETIKAIKQQLPNTSIVAVVDQDFIRTEDIHELFNSGADEVFANNFTFDDIVLSLQKVTRTFFYTEALQMLPKHKNILQSKDELKELVLQCIEKSIFFTAFVLKSAIEFPKFKKTSRKTDYMFQESKKIYYLAINTMPKGSVK